MRADNLNVEEFMSEITNQLSFCRISRCSFPEEYELFFRHLLYSYAVYTNSISTYFPINLIGAREYSIFSLQEV